MKIGLIGCAGLGKGTICKLVSERLKIDFVESKQVTRPVLKKALMDCSTYGFVENRLASKEYELEIVTSRIGQEGEHKNFITDRTVLECFAYAFLRLDTYSHQEFSLLEKVCREHMNIYTRLYYIPFDYGWQGENGIRTTNREFQWMVDKLIFNVINRWGTKVLIPNKEDASSIADQIVQGSKVS